MPEVPMRRALPSSKTGSSLSHLLALLALILAPSLAQAATDLAAEAVEAPSQIAPGTEFDVSWMVRNPGSTAASGIDYLIVLSSDDQIGRSDRELATRQVSAAALSGPTEVAARVQMPVDVPEGSYWIGVIVDPENGLGEEDIQNNLGASEPILVASTSLTILSTSLPATELGAPYCLRLAAAGGDGSYEWSLAGGALPPGLLLSPMTPGTTMLCGRASTLGSYDFSLEVSSAGSKESQAYRIEVTEGRLPLAVSTQTLPMALFRQAYSTPLGAVGGAAPYTWSLVLGKLPKGLHLRSDGAIVGVVEADGRFPLTLRATDAEGTMADRALELFVSSPVRLSCVSGSLPGHGVGEAFEERLEAAGGTRPYRWKSVDTRRLGGAIGEEPALLGEKPPPGLVLDSSGKVSGAATEIGHYIWTVEVSDAAQEDQSCVIALEIGDDHRLTIATTSLTAAVAGQSYLARLDATGATGKVSWSLLAGSRLPTGLNLDKSGLIDGTPSLDVLEGNERREFSFVLVAKDTENRVAIAPLGLTVQATPPRTATAGSGGSSEGGGCQAAAATDLGVLALGIAGLGLLQRRRADA